MPRVVAPKDPWGEIFADDPVLGFRVPPAWNRRKRSFEAFYDDETGFVFTTLKNQRTVFQHTDAGFDPDDAGYSLEAAPDGGPTPGMLDLALNALNEYVPPGADGEEVVECRRNVASRTAWELHEAFAREMLHPLAPDGGELDYRELMGWINAKRPGTEASLFGVREG